MAQATVKTVQYIDPRIEPQPDPIYDYVIGPTQNQYYKIPSSGLSNSNITFNNLTTLGVDRAYLDTFEIELTIKLRFYQSIYQHNGQAAATAAIVEYTEPSAGATANAHQVPPSMVPTPDMWTFQSFPFNTCCDQARVNINGGAFFSEPMSYVRAKERYMNQRELSRCYENVCPIHRPVCQTESTRVYNAAITATDAKARHTYDGGLANPSRYGRGLKGYMRSESGFDGGFNNSIVREIKDVNGQITSVVRGVDTNKAQRYIEYTITWREPLFVSPFSSRYDATYGRPLYNITSMDFAFNLMDLGNMIRLANYNAAPLASDVAHPTAKDVCVSSYTINIASAQLCYQVMTIPAMLQKPLTTLVPYRRFVPYITNYNSTSGTGGTNTEISVNGANNVEILSGVYTMNEIPTAIWIFCAPTKDVYQQNKPDFYRADALTDNLGNVNYIPCWDSNKLFATLKKVNISLANTTQILNTAEQLDLYRIAKANGCEDSFVDWTAGNEIIAPYCSDTATTLDGQAYTMIMKGAGSVLRLKPGVDIIVPDTPLIPGANANNMVFQVRATFDIPAHSSNQNTYALWLLFEYVGVAAISPGQCEITMNPLGSGEIVAASPVMSASSTASEGVLDGSGFWDDLKKRTRINRHLGDADAITRLLKRIPAGMRTAANWIDDHIPAPKRARTEGGAVMGRGLNDWV